MYVPSLLADFQRFFLDRRERLLRSFMDQLRYKAGPASLVARPASAAIVAVKIFVKKNVIVKIGVFLHFLILAVYRASSFRILFEDIDQATGNGQCGFFDRREVTGIGRVFDHEILAVIGVEFH